MDFRCCGKESIDCGDGAPGCLTASHYPAPDLRRKIVDRQDSALESQLQFITQPTLQLASTPARRQAFHTVVQFGQRDDADENAILVGRLQPGYEPERAFMRRFASSQACCGSRPVTCLYQAGWKVQAQASLTAPRTMASKVPGSPIVLW